MNYKNQSNGLLIKNLDVLYLITSLVVIMLDIFTISPVFEALAFVLIVLGFIFSVLPNKNNIKDERISYIKLYSGYTGFMLTTIFVSILSFAYRYIGFSINISDLFRYIVLFMYFNFTLVYSIYKRKM